MVDPLFPSASDATDVTTKKVVTQQLGEDPAQYFLGRIRLPQWVYAKPHRSFVYGDNISINANVTDRLDITMDADSYFIVEGLVIQSSEALTSFDDLLTDIQVVDSTYGQPWSNAPVPMRDIAGYGANMKRLPYPVIVRPSSTLSFLITNRASQSQTYYCAFVGRKVYSMKENEASYLSQRGFYQYVMPVPAIAAGVRGVIVDMQVLGGQDFLMKNILGSEMLEALAGAGSNASTDAIGQLRDTTNDYYFYNQKLNLRLWLGAELARISNQTVGTQTFLNYSYAQPFGLQKPVYLRANAILEGEFDNVGAQNLAAARITFEGARIYPGSFDAGAAAGLQAAPYSGALGTPR